MKEIYKKAKQELELYKSEEELLKSNIICRFFTSPSWSPLH